MKLTDNDLRALQIAKRFETEVFRFENFGKSLYPDMKFRRQSMTQSSRLCGERALRRLEAGRLIILTPFGYDGEYKLVLTTAGNQTLAHKDD